jgi:ligand-binding sensor domain-containing protein
VQNLPQGIADLVEIDGVLWAAGLGGVSRLDAGWQELALPMNARVVFSLEPGRDSAEIWFGSNAGAARLRSGEWERYGESHGLPHDVVHQVLVGAQGDIWFLCRTGVALMQGDELSVFRTDVNFRAGLVGPDGHPWFGTSAGLLRWTGSDFVVEMDGTTVYPMAVASDGAVWLGSASAGVFRLAEDGWTSPLPELRDEEVFDVAEGPSGEIWVASAIGLRKWRPDAAPEAQTR